MELITSRTVRQVAIDNPDATRVFEKLGIDYCCGGNRSLVDACTSVGVTVEYLMDSLAAVQGPAASSEERNFQATSMAELIDHIVTKHHGFTKTEIARLHDLIKKVYDAHGERHPELGQLRVLFSELSAELEPHMMKEERVLFPYIIAMEDAVTVKRTVPRPAFVTVANPVRMMMSEHDNAGALLRQMRSVTSNYTSPEDACISYQTLYQALDMLEKDLHQHIHLENNILFPRAVEVESQVLNG